jgi:hypothetical protein
VKCLLLAVFLVPSVLLAQSFPGIPPDMPQAQFCALPDNYEVTLTLTEKDRDPVEISIVIASTQFSASVESESLTFAGTLRLEPGSEVALGYQLAWQPPSVGNSSNSPESVQACVRLKLGQQVQIFRAGARTAKVSIQKLVASKP